MELKDLKDHPEEERIKKAILTLKKKVIKKRKSNLQKEKYDEIKKKVYNQYEIDFSKA